MIDLDRIHKIGELAAAIAVILSLIFVGYEIQQNNSAQKRLSTRSLARDWNITVAALQEPEIACIYHRMWNGFDDLTIRESRQIDTFLWRIYKVHEEMQYQFLEGDLDESVWMGFRNATVGAAANAPFREWWSRYRVQFGGRFRDHVDGLIENSPLREQPITATAGCDDSASRSQDSSNSE